MTRKHKTVANNQYKALPITKQLASLLRSTRINHYKAHFKIITIIVFLAFLATQVVPVRQIALVSRDAFGNVRQSAAQIEYEIPTATFRAA